MVFKGVLMDIAGVLTDAKSVIPGAVDALQALRQAGLPLRLVTNTSRRSKRQLLDDLCRQGLRVDAHEVFTAAEATVKRLLQFNLRPLLLVHPQLVEDFAGVGQGRPNAVVLGDAADGFTYARLNQAFRLLLDGAPLLALARNRYFREADGLSLDAGPFVAALEYAAEVEAIVFGKPAPAFFQAVLNDLGVAATDAIMIGDDVEADVNGALAVGVQAALVRTGKYRQDDEQRMHENGWCVADVGEAVAAILQS